LIDGLRYPNAGFHGQPEAGPAVIATASLAAPVHPDPAFDEAELDSFETNPLNAFTGVVWASIVGGALWALLVLALIFLD
jgi:hypothetical protein